MAEQTRSMPQAPPPVAVGATITSPHSALRSQANRPRLPRRQSRFTEEMAEDVTPAHSVYEHEPEASSPSVVSRGGYAPSSSATARECRPVELIIHGMNGCAHGAGCVILMAIMIEFLTQWEGIWFERMSAQAVALLVFLGLDTLLDVISLVRLNKEWPAWALVLRLLSAVVYIALFMVYVSHGRVFPPDFTFWAMSPGFAGPVVYLFLWLLGLWNLSHVALRRHRLGKGFRSFFTQVSPRSRLPTSAANASSDNRASSTLSPHQRRPLWRRWVRIGDHDDQHQSPTRDVEQLAPPSFISGRTTVAASTYSPAISLRDRPSDLKRPSYTATVRTASSHSSPRRERERDLEEKEEEGYPTGLKPPPPPPPPPPPQSPAAKEVEP